MWRWWWWRRAMCSYSTQPFRLRMGVRGEPFMTMLLLSRAMYRCTRYGICMLVQRHPTIGANHLSGNKALDERHPTIPFPPTTVRVPSNHSIGTQSFLWHPAIQLAPTHWSAPQPFHWHPAFPWENKKWHPTIRSAPQPFLWCPTINTSYIS